MVVHDAFLNSDKRGPRTVAAYSVLLMVITEGKCYAFAEMEKLLVGIGFSNVQPCQDCRRPLDNDGAQAGRLATERQYFANA